MDCVLNRLSRDYVVFCCRNEEKGQDRNSLAMGLARVKNTDSFIVISKVGAANFLVCCIVFFVPKGGICCRAL